MFLKKISAALPLHQALYNLPPSHITDQLKGGERERERKEQMVDRLIYKDMSFHLFSLR
jgi:hypothetical protein